MIFYLNTSDIGYSYHACEYSTYLVKVQYENEFCSPYPENLHLSLKILKVYSEHQTKNLLRRTTARDF